MTQKKKPSAQYSSLTGIHRAVPIILFAVAVFTMFCYITQDIGALGHAISTVFLGLFSYGAYAIPLLLAVHAVFYPQDISEKRVASRVIFSIIAITFISALAHSITHWNGELVFSASDYFTSGQSSVGGGFIGGTVAFCLMKIVGRVGLVIIAAAILAIYVSYFFASGKRSVSKLFYNILKAIVIVLATVEKALKTFFGSFKKAKTEKVKRDTEQKSIELTDDEFFAVDNGMQRLSVSELGIREIHADADAEGRTTLHDKVFHKSAVSAEEAEEMELREKAEEIFYASHDFTVEEVDEEPAPGAPRKRLVNIVYDTPEAGSAPQRNAAPEEPSPFSAPTASVAKDESADAIFTQSFDPYSMMMSEKLASKPSSRSLLDEDVQRKTITEDISELTEAELEREKQIREFERRKAAVIGARRAVPVDNDGEFKGTPKTVEFRERNDESLSEKPVETATASFTFDKAERTVEKPVVEPANYTAIGFGIKEEPATPLFTKAEFTEPETIYSYRPAVEEVTPTAYESYSAPKNEPAPASVPYVEESEAQVFERRYDTGSYGTYAPVSEPSPTVYERAPEPEVKEPAYRMFEEPAREEEVPFTYTATKDFGEEETEDYVPTFKPYDAVSREEISEPEIEVTDNDEPVAVSTLTVEREFVEDIPYEPVNDYSEEEDDEEDEAEEAEEAIAPPEDDGDAFEADEIPPEEQNPDVQRYKDMFSALRDDEPEEIEEPVEEYRASDYQPKNDEDAEEEEMDDEDDVPFDQPTVVRPTPQAKPEKKKEEKPEKKKPDFSHYQFPPIDLLGLDPQTDDDTSEINENTKILIDTLASFNVTAFTKGVDRGPRITRYEVVPARGVKVNSITNLYNDICLNLAKEGIRMEAPIPGKSAIGFEIPNKNPKNVRLRELLECEEYASAKSKTFVAIGKDVAGNPIFGDIAKYPHALICGATGMGKSVCINSILISMLYRVRPDEVKLIMVDPKKVEFKMYSGIPHLLIPVITESKQAAGALMWAVEEMERRYELIEKHNVRNLDAYNEKIDEGTAVGEKLPKIVIVIDELADLMMMVRDPVEDLIMRIAQKARAAGIHLIIGTQRPSVQVITGSIKANIPTRMSCKVTSQVDSRTVFDTAGAEKLLNRGDMLYSTTDRPKPFRVQGAYVSDKEVENIMEFLKSQSVEGSYDDEVFAEINKAAQKCGNKKSGGQSMDDDVDDGDECSYYGDQQFLDAVNLAIRSRKISTSLLQRKLSIGYSKAAKYIDQMEDIGVVSEPNGQKPRDVLITMDEWNEKLSRVDF